MCFKTAYHACFKIRVSIGKHDGSISQSDKLSYLSISKCQDMMHASVILVLWHDPGAFRCASIKEPVSTTQVSSGRLESSTALKGTEKYFAPAGNRTRDVSDHACTVKCKP